MGASKNPDFIPTAALRKRISCLHINHMLRCEMLRCEIFSAPCIWANSEFLEAPKCG